MAFGPVDSLEEEVRTGPWMRKAMVREWIQAVKYLLLKYKKKHTLKTIKNEGQAEVLSDNPPAKKQAALNGEYSTRKNESARAIWGKGKSCLEMGSAVL